MNPVLTLHSPSYSLAADSFNEMRVSSRHFQQSTTDTEQLQIAREINREANNSNSGRLKFINFKN